MRPGVGNKVLSASPTSRSLAWLTERGWEAYVVEKFNRFAGVRQDAFGFGDILAAHPQMKKIALVQTTTKANMEARRKKITSQESEENKEPVSVRAIAWLESGGEIQLHGWRKLKGDWVPDIEQIELSAFL